MKITESESFRRNSLRALDPCSPDNITYNCWYLKVFANPRTGRSGSEGAHVGYRRVVETFIGTTVYNFRAFPGGQQYFSPANGELLSLQSFDTQGQLSKQINYSYALDVNETRRSKSYRVPLVIANHNQDNTTKLCIPVGGGTGYTWLMGWEGSGGQCGYGTQLFSDRGNTKYSMSFYDLVQYWPYRKSATTSYFYAGATASIAEAKMMVYGDIKVASPTAVQLTNSDGVVEEVRYKYCTDPNVSSVLPTAVSSAMLARNLLADPIEVLRIRGGLQVDGTRLVYGLFGAVPYLASLQRYEATWDQNGVFQSSGPGLGWGTTATVNAYDNGRISSVTRRGWVPTTYTYTNGYLRSSATNGFVTLYDYDALNRLEKQTEVDGQVTYFAYDKLERLWRTLSRPKTSTPQKDVPGDFHVVDLVTYAYDQAAARNYREFQRTFTPTAGSALGTLRTREWVDGLGREIQRTKLAYTPTGKDLVISSQYDAFNRVTQVLAPVESTGSAGAYVTPVSTTPRTVTAYEASPLGRVTGQTPPGWYETKTAYGTNAVAIAVGAVTYPAGSLFATETVDATDVNWKTIVYADKLGRTVMSRRTNGASTLDTRYQYDQKDRLTAVLPPGVTAASSNLAFRYVYDGRDNVVSKSVPDGGTTKVLYNERDLMTYIADPNMQSAGQWLQTKYDAMGRPVSTGFAVETPTSGSVELPYSQLLTTSAYDGTAFLMKDKGKLTGETVSVLTSAPATFLTATYTYDRWGRLTQSARSNVLNGTSTTTFAYDWGDNLLSKTYANQFPGQTATVVDRHEFDHAGRSTRNFITATRNGAATSEVETSQRAYNYKDEVSTMWLGKMSGYPNFLQQVDYEYNVTGFLTKINAGNLTNSTAVTNFCGPFSPYGAPSASVASNDLFALALHYDTPTLASGSARPMRNGSIAQVDWQVRGRQKQSYGLVYDYAGRLTQANYAEYASPTATVPTVLNTYSTAYAYDPRGNFLAVTRRGGRLGTACAGANVIDDLSFGLVANSNRVGYVVDYEEAAMPGQGFPGSTSYTYDPNGNLKTDSHKGRTYTYNHLNLPQAVAGAGVSQAVTYSAKGEKLAVTTNGTTRYYFGALEYVGTTLRAIAHADGRIYYPAGVNYAQFEYSIKDHLGSVRVTFADKNYDGMITESTDPASSELLSEHHYYPFGMEMQGPWKANSDYADRTRYTGQELDRELGLYDYGARWYDPALGRFLQVDPLASSFPGYTPYHYVHNNPINLTDPTGMSASSPIFGTDGKFLGTDSEGFKGDIVIMDEKEYNSWTKADCDVGGDGTLDSDMTGLLIGAGVAQTLDNYIANDFSFSNAEDVSFVSKVFTGLIDAASGAGLIDYSSANLSGGNIKVAQGGGTDAANFGTNGAADVITVSVNPMSYNELTAKQQFSGTQSLHHLGNSGDAINILGVHEPMHRQYPGSANHPLIDRAVLQNRAAPLMSNEYRQKIMGRKN